MKSRFFPGFLLILAALVVSGGTNLALKERQAMLRAELVTVRAEAAELTKIRAENQRLRERQISAADLDRLRADHAALERLRDELESLRR